MSRFVAFENELGKCKHSFELPHDCMLRVSDLHPGYKITHPVERFRPGFRRKPADIMAWCNEWNIRVLHVYGEVFRAADIEENPNARAVHFPRPWLVVRFATLNDAMLFKLSWPE